MDPITKEIASLTALDGDPILLGKVHMYRNGFYVGFPTDTRYL